MPPKKALAKKVEHAPDLDAMTLEQLDRYAAETNRPTVAKRAKLRFPWAFHVAKLYRQGGVKLISVRQVSVALSQYASLRAMFLRTQKPRYQDRMEAVYKRLPTWARFRDHVHVEALVQPGAKFRKNPPRKPKLPPIQRATKSVDF